MTHSKNRIDQINLMHILRNGDLAVIRERLYKQAKFDRNESEKAVTTLFRPTVGYGLLEIDETSELQMHVLSVAKQLVLENYPESYEYHKFSA